MRRTRAGGPARGPRAVRPLAAKLSRATARLVALALASLLPIASPSAAAPLVPDGFLYEMVVGAPFTGQPVGVATLPDGRILVVERPGAVRVAPVAAGVTSSTVIGTVPGVTVGVERGLLGIAPDPAWPDRPYLYLYYTHVGDVGWVSMCPVTGDLTDPASVSLSLGAPYPLLTDLPNATAQHNGGTLRFGTDGMLYLSLGEDVMGCEAQDTTSLLGCLLRLDVSAMPDTAPGPPPKSALVAAGNPFAASANENARLIWAWGLRNPFRFEVDPATGDLWVADVGSNVFEEVDRLTAADAGANLGWPAREGFVAGGQTCGATGPFLDPVYVYAHGETDKAIIGGPPYRSGAGARAFPVGYDGSYFFAEYFEGYVRRLTHGPGGWGPAPAVPGQPDSLDWVTGIPSITDLVVGAEGELLFVTNFNTQAALRGVHRISWVGAVGVADAGAGVAREGAPDATVRPAEPAWRIAAAPNPLAGGAATIRVEGDGLAGASVSIFDVRGRLVRALDLSPTTAVSSWDGRLADGRRAAAGVYFARVAAAGRSATAKIVVAGAEGAP